MRKRLISNLEINILPAVRQVKLHSCSFNNLLNSCKSGKNGKTVLLF